MIVYLLNRNLGIPHGKDIILLIDSLYRIYTRMSGGQNQSARAHLNYIIQLSIATEYSHQSKRKNHFLSGTYYSILKRKRICQLILIIQQTQTTLILYPTFNMRRLTCKDLFK